ncbi:Hint domain-containing protein [Roseovarius sp. D22-M7]|uniref:Hint domain-containing protein n=1 Tax=Roseovarius sp. D22-M7 TaxID=3127116 RepID=UPI0030102F11
MVKRKDDGAGNDRAGKAQSEDQGTHAASQDPSGHPPEGKEGRGRAAARKIAGAGVFAAASASPAAALVPTPGNNILFGTGNDDSIDGLAGDDTIFGQGGDDTLLGGEGADRVSGNAGDDSVLGGPGNDTLFGHEGADTLIGGSGNDSINGGPGGDSIDGGDGDDTITGGDGADAMLGGDGDDTFLGATAGDSIDGGDGTDTIGLAGQGPFEIIGETTDSDGDSTSGTVNFLDGDGNVTGSFGFSEIENIVPCFTRGTRIATPSGECAVEDLRVGDRVITRDNGLQEIRWIGQRALTGAELYKAPHLRPVLIRAGALGRGLPLHDMLVSPQHRMLINSDRAALYFEDREVLASAKHLTDMAGVERADVSALTYVHFMFDQHEVVLSNGAWSESFQPGEQVLDGMGRAQRDEIFELFPDLRDRQGITAYQAARRALKRHEARLLVA